MNYLFFDIECSNGNNICSFGYVLTDEQFNIIKKEDIVMNPEANFDLGGRIELAYSEQCFRSQPNFDFHYNKIKEILENENQMVLGHSLGSDVNYLSVACRKFNKPIIKFNYYDTQKFFKVYSGDRKIKNLDGIIKDLKIDISILREHKSDDDAELSMLSLKQLCLNMNCDVNQLVEMSGQKAFSSFYYTFGSGSKAIKKFLSIIYDNFDTYERDKALTKVCFDEHLDKKNTQHTLYIIQELFKKGICYTGKASVCDIFVSSGKESIRYLPAVENAKEDGRELKILSFEEFLKEYDIDLLNFKEVNISREKVRAQERKQFYQPKESTQQNELSAFALAMQKAKEKELNKQNKKQATS